MWASAYWEHINVRWISFSCTASPTRKRIRRRMLNRLSRDVLCLKGAADLVKLSLPIRNLIWHMNGGAICPDSSIHLTPTYHRIILERKKMSVKTQESLQWISSSLDHELNAFCLRCSSMNASCCLLHLWNECEILNRDIMIHELNWLYFTTGSQCYTQTAYRIFWFTLLFSTSS